LLDLLIEREKQQSLCVGKSYLNANSGNKHNTWHEIIRAMITKSRMSIIYFYDSSLGLQMWKFQKQKQK